MQSALLNNVMLLERFLTSHKLMIPQLPSVMIVTPGELDRYIQLYIDDLISQYSEWCATTNTANYYEDEIRMKLARIATAYQIPLDVMFDEYFEQFDQKVLCPLAEQIQMVMNHFGGGNVTSVTYLANRTAFIENLGVAHEHMPTY